jgi:HSP20 family molecular chaperone IbpA
MRDFFFDDPFFKNSWEDFDKVRGAMFGESRDIWKRFDEDFRDTACMRHNIMLEPTEPASGPALPQEAARSLARQDSLARWEEGWMFPRRWMLPSISAPLKQMDLFSSKDSELIRTKEDEKKMEVSLDTAQYRPDELKITVEGGVVSVEGRHEEKAEDGTKMVSRSFSRKYTLPADARPEDVVSNLSSDGVLVITAPKKAAAITNVNVDHK